MLRKTDYEQMAGLYDQGRSIPLDNLLQWRDEVRGRIHDTAILLDLGAGTGLWASAFVEWFDVKVIAVEPSNGMRREAIEKRSHERIAYIGGRAEQLPLCDDSCGGAWLSTVVHHFADLQSSARELRRVLISGAPVLIRNVFAGRADQITWLKFWPHVRHLAERRWPLVDDVVRAFADAGFTFESLTPVRQQSASNLRSYRDRLAKRADSTLAELGDEEFEIGMRALDAAVEAEAKPQPVFDHLDLLVLR